MSVTPAGDSLLTSQSLLGLARTHDPMAWERLVRVYSPAIFGWAKRVGLDDEDSADVVQEVWIGVNRGLENFRRDRPADTFRGWLWTITRNKIGDLFRWREDSAVACGGTDGVRLLQNVPEVEPADDSATSSSDIFQQALDIIRKDFQEPTWQAFWRMVVLGQPAREVASQLSMAPNAVHQARFRVLQRLRKELVDLGIDNDPSFATILPSE